MSPTLATDNPYLMEFCRIGGDQYSFQSYAQRSPLVDKFAWAVPDEPHLRLIEKHGPILELGAGLGYWARLLRSRGVDVLAYDRVPSGKQNPFHQEGKHWTEVLEGGPGMAARYPKRTLFLCWPPYNTKFARDCLAVYKGNTLIYVGESNGGCTGDRKFFRLLSDEWKEVKILDLPQWSSIHDYFGVYVRKADHCKVKRGKLSHGRRWRHIHQLRVPKEYDPFY